MAVYLAHERRQVVHVRQKNREVDGNGETLRGSGRDWLAMTCDVSKYDNLQNYVENTIERFGRVVDVLINNASALALHVPFLDQDTDELARQLHTGRYSYWNLMKLSGMTCSWKGKNSLIINFTSGVYQVGFAQMAAYCGRQGGDSLLFHGRGS